MMPRSLQRQRHPLQRRVGLAERRCPLPSASPSMPSSPTMPPHMVLSRSSTSTRRERPICAARIRITLSA